MISTARTVGARRLTILAYTFGAVGFAASAQAAPQWPHCAVYSPTIMESLYAPAVDQTKWSADPIVVTQGSVYLAGAAFNWITGQMPHDIDVAFISWHQPGTDWFTMALPPVPMLEYRLLYRPDIRAHAAATMRWTHISAYTGFALYFKELPPLDTRFIRITFRDAGCAPTGHLIAVTVVP